MTHAVVIANFVQACCWWVDQAPAAGETRAAKAFLSEPGGKGLNVAIALQRLGVTTTAVLARGNDGAGAQLEQLLHQEGLAPDHMHTLDMQSGWGAGFIEPSGQNRIAVFPGANARLSRAHIHQARDAIAQASFIYAQLEVAYEAAEEAMLLGQQLGQPTVLNPSPWQSMSSLMRSCVRTYIVNASEASALLATPIVEPEATQPIASLTQPLSSAIAQFWRNYPGAQELVLTLGAWGCVGWQRPAPQQAAQAVSSRAPHVTVRDTVGCGDAFAAGYCWARYTRNQSMTGALAIGNACGALVASHEGVLAALPSQDRLTTVYPA